MGKRVWGAVLVAGVAAGCSGGKASPTDGGPDGGGACPALLPAAEWPQGTTHAANDPAGEYVVSSAETWTAAASPHRLAVNVRLDATLTLEPCAVVVMSSGRFDVQREGHLVADGNAAGPIVITGTPPADPQKGFLGITARQPNILLIPISLHDTTVENVTANYAIEADGTIDLRHVTLKTLSGGGVHLGLDGKFSSDSVNLTVTGGGKGDDQSGYAVLPLMLEAPSAATNIPMGSYTGNEQSYIGLGTIGAASRVLGASTTIHDRGVPYVLLTKLLVHGEGKAVLTVEPGVRFLALRDAGIVVFSGGRGDGGGESGGLLVEGTADKRVLLEGFVPQPGSWTGLQIIGEVSPLTLAYATFRHTGGAGGAAYASCPEIHSVRGDGGAVTIIDDDVGPFMTWVNIEEYTGVGIIRSWVSAGQDDTDYLKSDYHNMVDADGPCGMTEPVQPGGGCNGGGKCKPES